MRNLGLGMAVLFLASALGVTSIVTGLNSTVGAAAVEPPRGSYWRNHDGHWSYWHEGDKRWYYTDGVHWFYEDGKSWHTYRFDRGFGKEGFEHGEYKIPPEKAKIELPRHEVYRR